MPPGHDRPLIGVTTSEVRRAESVKPTPGRAAARYEMALGLTYLRAIEAAGGLPVVIPPLAPRRDRAAARPARRHLPLGRARPRPGDLRRAAASRAGPDRARPRPLRARDRRARRRAADADAGDLPRDAGAQRRPRRHPAPAPPRPAERAIPPPPARARRRSRPTAFGSSPGSRLGERSAPSELDVNSFHHQAIERLGEGLRATASAPDGTIEAVEDPSAPSWSASSGTPRRWSSAARPRRALFASFVDACRGERR